jgi:glutathione synthase/RimK-type ligase-like ATP-grasp enzyme
MSLKKIYIGSAVNRDLDIFEEIIKFAKINYNIKFINLFQKKGDNLIFNEKYFKKRIKKYPLSLIICKLFSEESNYLVYDALRKYASKIPLLNSLDSVQTCESRKATFNLIKEKCKKLIYPEVYCSLNKAYDALVNGKKIIVKHDIHNAPNLSKDDRIIGIARNYTDLFRIINNYKENELFFQEYLGKIDIVYKIYVIDHWAVSITAHNRLRHKKLSPLELIHIRVPIEKELKRRILRIGKKFGMSVYGVDYVLKDGIPYVVDINDFPSFRNIPEAISLISDYMYEFMTARQKVVGRIPMSLKSKTYML